MIAVTFPGQGSQKPGMGQEIFSNFDVAKEVFATVSDSTGLDLATLCFETDEETLRLTQNAQLALFTTSMAAWEVLKSEQNVSPSFFAGHSVGEYAAVVAAGAISLKDGAKLVQKRGEIMASAPPGTMAAVLGLDANQLSAALKNAEGVVVIANDNCPGQLVISGDAQGVESGGKLASEAGAKRVLPLNVSGAFHSPLMAESAKQMGEFLRSFEWQTPHTPVVSNVQATGISDGAVWADLLEKQLQSSVRWTESIQYMLAAGVDTFIECGEGEVLSGLLKRISKEVKSYAFGSSANLPSFEG